MITAQVGVCRALLKSFAVAPDFAFAYGSGALPQAGYGASVPMLDLIFAVDDAAAWHRINLERNPSHYSFLRFLGADRIRAVQDELPAGVYFNTLVPAAVDGRNFLFKYGVVSCDKLLQDLRHWTHLYLAGRLHKPIRIVEPAKDSNLLNTMQTNLTSAVKAALLVLPERFDEYQLYHAISELSYRGDFRMIFGENKQKVHNIVTPQIEEFRLLYDSPLKSLRDRLNFNNGHFVQDVSEEAKFAHVSELPSHVQKVICDLNEGSGFSEMEILKDVSQENTADRVRCALEKIVFKSSALQSIKSIFTAGIIKSLTYSARKIKKMF